MSENQVSSKPKIGYLVNQNTYCAFKYYRDGDLWYDVMGNRQTPYGQPLPSEKLYSFAIPISDTGTGIFENVMKSVYLMRWIRKQLDKDEER